MAKIKNYNYIFLVYDVGEKRVNKVFKICKKYLSHFQKSVFRGEISPSNLITLKAELRKIIDPGYDFICIIKLMSNKSFDEEILGIKPNKTGEDLII